MVQSDSSGVPLPREKMPDWLLPLRNAFLASLLSLGLKTGTVRNYAPAVDWLCAEAGRRGLTTPDDVDGSRFLRRSGSRCRRGFRFTAGAIGARSWVAPSPIIAIVRSLSAPDAARPSPKAPRS